MIIPLYPDLRIGDVPALTGPGLELVYAAFAVPRILVPV